MRNPKSYKAIAAWGMQLGSFGYYIEAQQQKAAEMNAPLDALYERNGEWARMQDLAPKHSFRAAFAARFPEDKELAERVSPEATQEAKERAVSEAAKVRSMELLGALESLLALAGDPAGGTYTLKEVFGVGHCSPGQIEGQNARVLITACRDAS